MPSTKRTRLGDLVNELPTDQSGDETAFFYLDSAGEVDDSVTFRELRERCRTVAARLSPLAEPGAVAVILATEGLEFVEAFFGCIMAGLVPAPLRPPRHERDESAWRLLLGCLRETGAAVLIAGKPQLKLVRDIELLRQALVSGGVRVLTIDDLRSGAGGGEHAGPFPVQDPDQAAYLQYTSGSTLNPRGVVVTHRNAIASLEYMSHTFRHHAPHRGAGWLPMFHDMGLVGHVMMTLFEGGFTVLMAPSTFLRDPAIWLKSFGRFHVNRAATTLFALNYCVRKRVFEDRTLDLSGWKYAYLGAETIFSETLDRFAEAFRARGFRRTAFCPTYGLSEATLMAAGGCEDERIWSPRRFANGSLASSYPLIGYKVDPAFVDVRIVDPSSGRPLSSGERGEVWIAGDCVSKAYVNQPKQSAETLQARLPGEKKLFARTGDLGALRDGRLYLVGRLKDIIVLRGVNFASEDLEYTVGNSHEKLRFMDACCCFSVVEDAAERLFVVQEIDRHLPLTDRDEILDAVREALLNEHGLAAPAVLLIPAGTMTRTANGKIARTCCRERVLKGGFTRLASWPAAKVSPAVSSEPNRDGARAAEDDSVAIIGMACRFPGGADNPEAFWKFLVEGGDAIVETPPERWNNDLFFDPDPAVPEKMNTRWGGFLQGIDQFDPGFFGISPREATEIDPQQRMLLETSWRLFEDAGLTLERLKGSHTGVYLGLSTNDYLYMKIKLTPGMGGFNAYSGLGNANSIAANRLSYIYDLRGPSLTIDTACSSSLTALHLAAESVRKGECSMAITGGVNAMLTPGLTITLSQFGMMAPDGRCKVFDERANGYVRSEGCGLVMLKRKSDALRDGDRILACILGSAIGQDGRTQGITMPGEDSQRELIEKTIRIAGIEPAEIGYVEAHGTGTAVGDPAEMKQLKATYGRTGSRPCYVGSVKANLGHLESAAGIASVIKTLLVLRHGLIPPQIHLQRLNPRIDLRRSRLTIPNSLCEWPDSGGPRRAAISSFGFGGANAHVILEGAPDTSVDVTVGAHAADEGIVQICPLSWKSEEAVPPSVNDWTTWLESNPEPSLPKICRSLATRRTHFSRRLALVADSKAELIRGLKACAGRAFEDTHPLILPAFLFPGQGEAYVGMGSELHGRYPVFQQALDRCAAAFDGIVTEGPGFAAGMLDGGSPVETAASIHDQTCLFAVEYALAQLWMSWGILPVALLGHSLGEYAAACVAGCIEPEDGVRLLIERSRLIDSVTAKGSMAVVCAGETELRERIDLSGLSIAAINSPFKTVLAGEVDDVAAAVAELGQRGLDSRLLPVRQAFHSSLLDVIVDEFEEAARGVHYRAPQLTWISSLTGAPMTGVPGARHWRDHLRSCVRYADGVRTIDQLGCNAYIQMGPGAALLPLVGEVTDRKHGLLLRSLEKRRQKGEAQLALEALGTLYERGVNPNWEEVFASTDSSASPVESIPRHPFLKKRYWMANAHPDHFAALSHDSGIELTTPESPEDPIAAGGRSWMYEVEWQPCPFKRKAILTPASETQVRVANWIIVGGEGGLADQLSRLLQAAGFSTYLILRDLEAGAKSFSKAVSGRQGPAGRFSVAPACGRGNYRDVLRHILSDISPGGVASWRLLYLGSNDAGDTDTLTVPKLEEYQNVNGIGDALRLTQAILEMNCVISMWIVTRNTQWLKLENGPDNAAKINVAQAPLWGFGKTLYLENPELRGGLIDIDDSDEATSALQIAVQASEPEGEHCVAFRGGERYLSRIVRVAQKAEPLRTTLRSDGVYVVTGGMGGLGLRCAGWLAKRGVRDLVLVGRSAFPVKESWSELAADHPDHQKIEALRAIENLGAEVEILSADVRESGSIESLFARLKSDGRPIRGIIHAAGVNWLGKIRDIDTAKFLETMRIKVSATWVLHELTREEDLDLFVLFSSVSALWGSVNLSHYTAANHFMDALSCYRAGNGLPSLSVQWGPWAEIGMSSKERETAPQLAKLGLRLMPPDEAILALEASLSHGRPLSLLADVDWKTFQTFVDFSLSPALFSQFSSANAAPSHGSQNTQQKLRDAHAVNPKEARSLVDRITREALASVHLVNSIETLDPERRFNLMGMDSLMAIAFAAELERVLNIKIPNTLAYTYPTIRAVVEYLYQELVGAQAPEQPRSVDTPEAQPESRSEPVAPADEVRPLRLFRIQPSRASTSSPRLFCFPYAGAGASAYGTWNERLSNWCELILVQFPGREDLSDVPPLHSVRTLASLLADNMPSQTERPFVFFGHSLGAAVAFELTMELRRHGQPLPQHLILSGCNFPAPETETRNPLHRRSDEEFQDAITESYIGGELPSERREIAGPMLPLLRADIEMANTYGVPDEEPLKCPLTVFAATNDSLTCREGMMGWHAMTKGDFFLRQFPGGREFVKVCEVEVIESIKKTLN